MQKKNLSIELPLPPLMARDPPESFIILLDKNMLLFIFTNIYGVKQKI